LLGNLAREHGDDLNARDHYLAGFVAMGWPAPASNLYGAGLPGIARALGEGGVFIADGLRNLDNCRTIASEIDGLAASDRLYEGGFYDDDRGVCSAGRCDKRRAEYAELATEATSLPAVEGLVSAIHRIVLANNFLEGTTYYPLEVQLAYYAGDGAVYAIHTDTASGHRLHRTVSLLYYPNPTWIPGDGGLLRVETASGWRGVEPQGDRLVGFASRSRHEVTPCARTRRSVTCWCWSTSA
jgi:hypothetical protein